MLRIFHGPDLRIEKSVSKFTADICEYVRRLRPNITQRDRLFYPYHIMIGSFERDT